VRPSGFGVFAWRTTLAHVATYLVFGLVASSLFDYQTLWASEWMDHYRPFDHPLIALGPSLQVIRGLILAAVLYPFRRVILADPRGWLKLWALLVGIGILSTYAAAPGSVEGVLYTSLPWRHHVIGVPEVWGQTLAFSLCLVGWYRRPHRAWGWALGVVSGFAVFVGVAGALLAPAAG